MKPAIEHMKPTAKDKAKAQELDALYPYAASIVYYQGVYYARINQALTPLEQVLEGLRDEIAKKIILAYREDGTVSMCANCEQEFDPKKAVQKWLIKSGINVSHGICKRHFDETLREAEEYLEAI